VPFLQSNTSFDELTGVRSLFSSSLFTAMFSSIRGGAVTPPRFGMALGKHWLLHFIATALLVVAAVTYLLTGCSSAGICEQYDHVVRIQTPAVISALPLLFLIRYLLRKNGTGPEDVRLMYRRLPNGAGCFQGCRRCFPNIPISLAGDCRMMNSTTDQT